MKIASDSEATAICSESRAGVWHVLVVVDTYSIFEVPKRRFVTCRAFAHFSASASVALDPFRVLSALAHQLDSRIP